MEPVFDTEDRQYVEDVTDPAEQNEWGEGPDWQKKKKKKQKGSRRGLRAKKRDV